ncbi:MAG: uncharacterized protein PWQ58_1602 [Archaeoglobaceae archaeon]|nr:uncharacterized protein [Archaeoglobaceae archaeon]
MPEMYRNLDEPYKTLAEKLLDALRRKYGERLISLAVFGSVARREARKDSDLDMLLIIDSAPKKQA